MDTAKSGASPRPGQPPPGFSLSGEPNDRPSGLTLVDGPEMRKASVEQAHPGVLRP